MAVGEASALVFPEAEPGRGRHLRVLHASRASSRSRSACPPLQPTPLGRGQLRVAGADHAGRRGVGGHSATPLRHQADHALGAATVARLTMTPTGSSARGAADPATRRPSRPPRADAAAQRRAVRGLPAAPSRAPDARRAARTSSICICRWSSTARAGSATAVSRSRTSSRSARSACSSRSTGSTPTAAWSSRRTRRPRSSARSSDTSGTRAGRSGSRAGCRSCACRSARPAPS